MNAILKHTLSLALGSALLAIPAFAMPQSQNPPQQDPSKTPPAQQASPHQAQQPAAEQQPHHNASCRTSHSAAGSATRRRTTARAAERYRQSQELQGRRGSHRRSQSQLQNELVFARKGNRPGQEPRSGSRALLQAD